MEIAIIENYIHFLMSSLYFIEDSSFGWPMHSLHHLLIHSVDVYAQHNVKVDGASKLAQIVPPKSIYHITE
jgi:hypothetical protein